MAQEILQDNCQASSHRCQGWLPAQGAGSLVTSNTSITAGYKWVGAVYKTAVSFQRKSSGWGFVLNEIKEIKMHLKMDILA